MRSDLGSDRHVLLVGGAGYIGSVLSRRLLETGAKVRVLDALLYGNGPALTGTLDEANFSFVYGDFCSRATLTSCMKGVTDVVLLAALVGDPICKAYPDEARRINEQGAIQLFEELSGYDIDSYVFLSTCSNYGLLDTEELADEGYSLNPQSLYAETKVKVEEHILSRTNAVRFKPVVLRLSTAYGLSPRMRFDLTVAEFTRELALGRELVVYDEHTWRPYCHIEDISTAVIRALQAGSAAAGQVFNVGSSAENYTKKMIVDAIVETTPSARVRYHQGGTDPRNYRVCFDKIQAHLGFETARTLKGSIPPLAEAIRSHVFDDVEKRRDFFGNYTIPQDSFLEDACRP